MTTTIEQHRQQAWDTTSDSTLWHELKQRQYRLAPLNAGRLHIDPPPTDERIVYLVRKHKRRILDRLKQEAQAAEWDQTEADRLRDSLLKVARAHGMPDTKEAHEKLIGILEQFDHAWQWHNLTALRAARLDVERFYSDQGRFDQERSIRDEGFFSYKDCRHLKADYFRVKLDLGVAVRRMCPDCGRHMTRDPDDPPPKKRSQIPYWPDNGPDDPDAEISALIEWFRSVEGTLEKNSLWSPGITVLDEDKCRQSINNLIALWKLGDVAPGLEAQLSAFKKHREATNDA